MGAGCAPGTSTLRAGCVPPGLAFTPLVATITTPIVAFAPPTAVAEIITEPAMFPCTAPVFVSTLAFVASLLVKVTPLIAPVLPSVYIPVICKASAVPAKISGAVAVPVLPLTLPVGAVTVSDCRASI